MIVSFLSFFATIGDSCDLKGGSLLGFPHWYKYLQGTIDAQNKCTPQAPSLSDVWLIVAAGIEVLLRIAAIAAVGLIIYGGIQYVISQGEPDKTTKARGTITNALVGLAIAVTSAAIVSFLARSIT